MTLRLRTFGSVVLTRDGAPLSGAAGQRRFLAVLTVLAAAGERGISRDKLLGLLWSEGDPEKSRHALTQSLYHIRKALGVERVVLGGAGANLRVDPALMTSDVGDFQRAIAEHRLTDAESLYTGPFLDGFHLSAVPEFDFWISTERDRYARQYVLAVNTLAENAARAKDAAGELRWRERLAGHDPLDGTAVAGYMRALVAAGEHATALQRAHTYTARLRDELDLPPDRAVVDLVADLRARAKATSLMPERSAEPPVEPTPPIVVAARTETTVRPEVQRPERHPRRRRAAPWIAAALTVAFAAVMTRVAVSRALDRDEAPHESVVMIAPFRVASTDAASAYLREGLLDLLAARLVEPTAKRAVDPARVLRAWRAAGFEGASQPSSVR